MFLRCTVAPPTLAAQTLDLQRRQQSETVGPQFPLLIIETFACVLSGM